MTGERVKANGVVLGLTGLLWTLGCGGGDGPIQPPPPPPPPPDIAGVWSGTEVVQTRGGTGCNTDVEDGTRTGNIFTVTQNGVQIGIVQHTPCVICQYQGTIAESGSFQATGTSGPATIRVEGQVTGNHMTATRRPIGVDCDRLSQFDLTRN